MALRAPALHLRSPSASSSSSSNKKMKKSISSSSSSSSTSLFIRASLKQEKGRAAHSHTSPSDLGLHMAVSDLERLFRQADGTGVDPPSAGSSGRPVRVAYQGVLGSYCQEAAAKAFPSLGCEAFPCNNMDDAFAALEDRSADRAVVPVENSLDGPIGRNFDLLLRHGGVQIVGELVLPVNHCLLSLPDAPRSAIRRVVSHPQALSHCRESLKALDLEIEEVSNAADAARYVAENRIADTAVIGSKIAAREFGLRVMEQNFQDRGGNFNRFLQLGLGTAGPSSSEIVGARGARKTTVAFALEKGVSDLFRAMWIFESRGVAVTRVEHRPNRSNPVRIVEREGTGEVPYLDYVFILDLEGSASDACIGGSLACLREIAGFVRVLGSYRYNTCGARE